MAMQARRSLAFASRFNPLTSKSITHTRKLGVVRLFGTSDVTNRDDKEELAKSAKSHFNKYKTIHESPKRLVCMGDIHGDVDALEDMLLVAGLIGERGGEWIGGSTVVVQVGDILDRGIKEVDILLRMEELCKQAKASDGNIIRLVGNHEIMNYDGDFRYASGDWGDGYQPFEDKIGTVLDKHDSFWRMSHDGLLKYKNEQRARAGCFDLNVPFLHECIEPFRSTTQVAVIVGKTLFVHGGIATGHLEFISAAIGGPLWELALEESQGCPHRASLILINLQSHMWIHAKEKKEAPLLLTHPNGCVWMRHFSSPMGSELQATVQELLADVLGKLGCDRMVVGHTPQPCVNYATATVTRGEHHKNEEGYADTNQEYQIWRVDTGVSSGIYSGPREILEIRNEGFKDSSKDVLNILVAGNSLSPLPNKTHPYELEKISREEVHGHDLYLLKDSLICRKAPVDLAIEKRK